MPKRNPPPPISEQIASPEQQARLLGMLLDGSSALVGLKDLNHRYLFANLQLEALYGVPHGAMAGKTSSAYLTPEHVAEIHAREDGVIQSGQPVHFVERLVVNGHPHLWETIRFPFRDLSGEIVGSGFIAIDVSEGAGITAEQRHTLQRAREQAALQRPSPSTPPNDKPGLAKLIWHTTHECGNPTIDRQHRGLFERANTLLQALVTDTRKEDVLQLMRQLMDDMTTHFHDEESILRQTGFPHVAEHHHAHEALLNKAAELTKQFQEERLLIEDLYHYIAHDMIAMHIQDTDRDYFAFMNPHFPVLP